MIEVILTLVVVGIILWLVSLLPIDTTILLIIRVVAVICVVFWLLHVFGVFGHDIPVPQLR